MLRLYREALRIRRSEPGLGDGPFSWLDAQEGVLAFARGARFASVTNLSAVPVPLPDDAALLLSSSPLDDGLLPPDSTAWLRTQHRPPETSTTH